MLNWESLHARFSARNGPPKPSGGFLLSRRAFLSAAVAAPLGFSKELHASLLFKPLQFSWNGDVFSIVSGHQTLWSIDPCLFAGQPRLVATVGANRVFAKLEGAYFPATSISADIVCEFCNSMGMWSYSFTFPAQRLAMNGDLSSWLELGIPATAFVREASLQVSGSDRIATGPAQVDFLPSWSLRFSGDIAVQLEDGVGFGGNHLELAPASHGADRLLQQDAHPFTRMTIRSGGARWLVEPLLSKRSSDLLAIPNDTFGVAELEYSNATAGQTAKAILFNANPEARAWLLPAPTLRTPSGELFKLNLSDPAIVVARDGAHRVETLFAALSPEPTWLENDGALLALGGGVSAERKRLFVVNDGEVASFDVEPEILKTWVSVDGGVAEPGGAMGERLAFVDFDGARRGSVQSSQISTDALMRLRNFSISLRRPEDFLVLDFDFVNLELGRKDGARVVRPVDTAGPSYIVVNFPPQHIAEEAFQEASDTCGPGNGSVSRPPIRSRMSGPSRLVFEIPPEIRAIPFTVDGLLDWTKWKLKVPKTAVHTNAIAPPEWNETSIEMPYRLFLAPEEDVVWRHAGQPVRHSGRTELWHTRMDVANAVAQFMTTGDPRARLTASWSPDFAQVSATSSDAVVNLPFRTTINRLDRNDIVRLSRDSTACAEPFRAELTMLSSLGGWLRVEGNWPDAPARSAISTLEKWEQRITLARDQYGRIERRAYFYPFGHRISVVTETARKPGRFPFGSNNSDIDIAYDRQRTYVVIKEREITLNDPRENPLLCFRSVRILDDQSPPLDSPETAGGGSINGWGKKGFWPTVCGKRHEFRIETVDWVGNVQQFSVPVIVVEAIYEERNGTPIIMSILADADVEYRNALSDRYRRANSQTIAFGRARQKGDTEVEALTVAFDGQLLPYVAPVDPTSCAPFSGGGRPPPFRLTVDEIEARVPAINQLGVPGGSGAPWFKPVDPDDPANTAEIFARISRTIQPSANFHQGTDKAGGIAAPTPNSDALSRTYGLVNSNTMSSANLPAAFAADGLPSFDPSSFFDSNATILGIIPLSKIISALRMGIGLEVPAALSVLSEGGDIPSKLGTSLNWETTALKNWPDSDPIFAPREGARLALDAGGYVWIPSDLEPVFSLNGTVQNFDINVIFGGIGFIVHFTQVTFSAGSKQKASFDIVIEGVDFKGAILEFVNALRSFLSFLDGDNALGLKIDVRPDGITITVPPLTIPPLQLGVFSLEQLCITNSCILSFRNQPIRFRFDFSTRDAPFIVGVGILAGTGFFGIEVDTQRIRAIEAAIEFGAYKSIDFGGIAKGVVYVLGGVYYASRTLSVSGRPDSAEIIFSAYVRAGGGVTALGFISVGVELLVSLNARSSSGETALWGTTSCSYNIRIGFFKKSFTITYTQEFQGSASGNSSKSVMAMTSGARVERLAARKQGNLLAGQLRYADWQDYVEAFA